MLFEGIAILRKCFWPLAAEASVVICRAAVAEWNDAMAMPHSYAAGFHRRLRYYQRWLEIYFCQNERK